MEGWIIAGVWIAVLSLFILLNSGIANAFVRIAKMKGHPGQKYFWWCFCTGAGGLLDGRRLTRLGTRGYRR